MSNRKKAAADHVRWDLSCLYKGLDDPEIEANLAAVIAMAEDFKRKYQGNLNTRLGDAIADYMAFEMLSDKIGAYLFLSSTLDLANEAVKTRLQEVQERLSACIGENLVFFDHELVALDQAEIDAQALTSEVVKHHLPWIRHERIFKPHLLSEEVEGALAKRELFGPRSWAQFYSEVEADLRFDFNSEPKTLTEMLHIMTESRDPGVRAKALKVINDGLDGPFLKLAAQTLNMVVRFKALETDERNYHGPMSLRNMANRVPDDVVEALHEAVTKTAAPLAQRFYRLKAAHLGQERLLWSDRNANIPFSDDTIIPFDEAMDIVHDAYHQFSPKLAELVKLQRDSGWIDAPAGPSKRSGAFNLSFTAAGLGPMSLALLNYLGTSRDVMALAHELGHGVHGLLAGEAQGVLMQSAPTAYAETASVFGEAMTFNSLRSRLQKRGDKEAFLALIMSRIDDMVNTSVLQISLSNFEKRVHNAGRRLSPKEFGDIRMETIVEMYGEDGDVFEYKDCDRLWSYLHHFHRPFYVYAYACGELLTQSIMAKREELGDGFEPLYLDMLRAGSSKNAIELLEPFGLDPRDPSFWTDGICAGLEPLIEEAEKLSQELGIRTSDKK